MKARHRQALALAGIVTGFVASAALAPAGAQRPVDPKAPRIMVPAFRGSERGLGAQAANEIRNRLPSDFAVRVLTIIPKEDIEATLKASGFDPAEPLPPSDARELGRQLRADEYLDGTVTKTATGYRIESRLVLVRDNQLRQPLPVAEGARVNDAARAVSRSLVEARKQLDAEKECVAMARERKYPEALAAARRGIAAYPQATLSRLCLMATLRESNGSMDTLVAAGEEVRRIDPRNIRALQMLAEAYDKQNNDAKAVEVYTSLAAADPTNIAVLDQAVRRITGAGQPQLALPIIKEAVEQNPGEPNLLRTYFLIQLAARDYKGGTATGEELIKADTAAADTTWFTRMGAAYAADSQPQKAAEVLARGVARFPNSVSIKTDYAAALSGAGQSQQALEFLRRNPTLPGAYRTMARIYVDMQQPDTALATLRQASAAGDSAALIAPYVLTIGNQLYRTAAASKKVEDFTRAMGVLMWADSLQASPTAKFLIGASATQAAQAQLTTARESKSCPVLGDAQRNLTLAQINLPAGGQAFPQPTAQLLTAVGQLAPYADALGRQLRCGAAAPATRPRS